MSILKKSEANHNNAELSIYRMVLNRLPIIEDTDSNKTLLSSFILEMMVMFNKCIGKTEAQLGIESNYLLLEQSMLADLVSLKILVVYAIESTGGNATAKTSASNTYLSKAKAGSVEVEYDALKLSENASLTTSVPAIYKYLRNDAINKADQIGCKIDITDDFYITFKADDFIAQPFVVFSGCPDKDTVYPTKLTI